MLNDWSAVSNTEDDRDRRNDDDSSTKAMMEDEFADRISFVFAKRQKESADAKGEDADDG